MGNKHFEKGGEPNETCAECGKDKNTHDWSVPTCKDGKKFKPQKVESLSDSIMQPPKDNIYEDGGEILWVSDVKEAVKKLKEIKEEFDLKRMMVITQFSAGNISWGEMVEELVDLDDKFQNEINQIFGDDLA